jgi:glycosyltransferase involved in cell wall biosynthesis
MKIRGIRGCFWIFSIRLNMPLSTIVFTLNEEANLPHCLESLKWCADIIVVDSGSSDRTVAIAENFGARVFVHAFEGFGKQRNWAVENSNPKNEWILILDADERVQPELAEELANLARNAPQNIAAYRLRRRFHMWGKWLKHSSLYPTWVVRFVRKNRVRYMNRGHGETQVVEGEIGICQNDLIDENHKGIDEWFERQNRYSSEDLSMEIREYRSFQITNLFHTDPLKRRFALKVLGSRLPLRGFLYFLYAYLFRFGFLDGIEGFQFCRMRAMYYSMIELKRFESRKKLS